ncbi:MAG TPA: YceI family protein, partial [Candidatus Eisenbacteria bacterium]|nr:YceI family protein [Candidatus Eisenbacteria bacterium]
TRVVDGVELPAPGTFVLDPAHSRVGFVARHLMVTKVRGHFAEVEGTVTIAEDPLQSRAEATIAAASITTGAADRDTHLRSGDFLEVEKHPTLTFAITRVLGHRGAAFQAVGDLTIKGVTREVELEVEVDGVARDPWGNEKLALTASTEIDRDDFGITWNVALETGGVLVSRKIKIEIEAQAVRQA